MKLVILLTGTIRPQVKGGSFSVEERMEMYTSTLHYYAKKIGKKYPIVFVENSDISLELWKEEFSNSLDLEILQFPPTVNNNSAIQQTDNFDNSRGKSYNEYLMIKKGLLHSEKMKDCTHFLKITGRYAMLNITKIMYEIEKRMEGKVWLDDVKDTRLHDLIAKKDVYSRYWADSRYFVAEINYYKDHFMNIYESMNDYVWRENAEGRLFDLYKENNADKRFLFRFRTQVQFYGKSGHETEGGYGVYGTPKDKLKNFVRQVLRYLAPYIYF